MKLPTQSRSAILITALLGAVVLASIPVCAADQSGYTLRATANEVRLAFAASDRQGHSVKTLRSADIAVADNGSIIRQFRSFRPASESPLDLVILLDASDSVGSQITGELAAARNFVRDSAWDERDRVSILAFGGSRPQLLCARNCKGETASLKLSALRANGLTPLYDALFQASELLKETRDAESRPAMILFSDGVGTISMHDLSDVLEAAQNLQAAIYSVNSRSAKSAPTKGDAVLNCLAGSTGGLSFVLGQNVKEVLRTVVEDLHSGYVLTYELPVQLTGQHSVRILPTSNPKLQFRARAAYNDSGDE
jgi:VWFA-related protein